MQRSNPGHDQESWFRDEAKNAAIKSFVRIAERSKLLSQ